MTYFLGGWGLLPPEQMAVGSCCHPTRWAEPISASFYRFENWESVRLSASPKVTHLLHGEEVRKPRFLTPSPACSQGWGKGWRKSLLGEWYEVTCSQQPRALGTFPTGAGSLQEGPVVGQWRPKWDGMVGIRGGTGLTSILAPCVTLDGSIPAQISHQWSHP